MITSALSAATCEMTNFKLIEIPENLNASVVLLVMEAETVWLSLIARALSYLW